jgi:hypothetical protein
MGVGSFDLEVILKFHRDGMLPGKFSVAEIGAQELGDSVLRHRDQQIPEQEGYLDGDDRGYLFRSLGSEVGLKLLGSEREVTFLLSICQHRADEVETLLQQRAPTT